MYEKESLEQYAFSVGHSLTQYDDHLSDDKFIKQAEKATPIFDVNKFTKRNYF